MWKYITLGSRVIRWFVKVIHHIHLINVQIVTTWLRSLREYEVSKILIFSFVCKVFWSVNWWKKKSSNFCLKPPHWDSSWNVYSLHTHQLIAHCYPSWHQKCSNLGLIFWHLEPRAGFSSLTTFCFGAQWPSWSAARC